ncbi:Origin recognition complex, subunit 1 [Rhizina undulata]
MTLKDPARRRSSTTLSRARKLLRGVGVEREDSDDELGYEDLPWEWIYSPSSPTTPIGAKMGHFDVQIGDCVLVKGEGLQGEAYVGMVVEFLDEERGGLPGETEMMVNVMWFSTEFEVKNATKKRMDYLPNELYINPSYNTIPLSSINGRAIVCSEKKFNELYPTGVPKKSREHGKVFICRRGCNPRTATYTEEFIWEDIWKGRDTNIYHIGDLVKKGTKATRKRAAVERERIEVRRVKRKTIDEGDNWDPGMEDIQEENSHLEEVYTEKHPPRTPTRRRARSAALATPSRRTPTGASKKLTTPTSKRITVKKPLLFTPLATRVLSPATHLSTPYALARHRLHVSTLPATLPCRENEFTEVYTHLSSAITDGTGSCIYISGTPGTGKTATVREVISQLQSLVAAEELDDFTFVEINGMKITDPHQSYSLLWEAIKGDRVAPSQALELLEMEFSTPSPRRVPCVVLMDELDQLVTRGQGVMYNFFNWPGGRYSRLIVLAVANTMDLPERTLSNKISSRLGLTRITFPGYTHSQLMTIIQSRLSGVPGNIVDPDAIQFAARKVAAVSGDARRALDICRRAVEIVEYSTTSNPPDSPSKRHPKPPIKEPGRVTIATIKAAINEATSSPIQQFLRHLPLTSKVLLAAILARIRRSGVGENMLGDVIEEAERMVKISEMRIQELLLGDEERDEGGNRRIGERAAVKELPRIRGVGAAVLELAEAGVVAVEARRGERGGRVSLNVSEEEVKAALRDDAEMGGMVGR